MKVLITGATGLIGSEIVKQCHENSISVNYLTTSKEKLSNELNYKGFFWNPSKGEIDTMCLDGVDAIINLAGTTISKRWTSSNKIQMEQSRLQSLKLLRKTISENEHSISQIISASAIGAYPDSLVNYYDEDYPVYSTTFLGELVEQWEAAADAFSKLNIKVSKIRIGLVLANNGGMLPQIEKPVRLGLGAPFGSGDQWQSWIHISDLARQFLFVLEQELEGVYNGVAPNPVIQIDFIKAVAKTLDKPLLLPKIPEIVMKIALGEMHILLFESQRVSSKKIEEEGFNYEYANLQLALDDLLCK